jgi:hypothetical protein
MQNQNPSSANFFLIMRKTGCYVVDPELGPFHIDLENVIKNEVPRDRQLIWVLVVELQALSGHVLHWACYKYRV